MTTLVIKLQYKGGQTILRDLTLDHTLNDLHKRIATITRHHSAGISILFGYPPKPLDVSDLNVTIGDSGIRSGDTLIIAEKLIPLTASKGSTNITIPPASAGEGDKKELKPNLTDDYETSVPGRLVKQVVPADNSCLFTSIGFVMTGRVDLTCGPYMRQIIAVEVLENADVYSTAILGRPNTEYVTWIMLDESWGGAIELAILSHYYGMEIAVVDAINGIVSRFGEDQNYGQRVFLLFDGIHYDPLYLLPNDGQDTQTIFCSADQRILETAEELAREEKRRSMFTDVNHFTLKCLLCGANFIGQRAAQDHAKETGHTNFGEIQQATRYAAGPSGAPVAGPSAAPDSQPVVAPAVEPDVGPAPELEVVLAPRPYVAPAAKPDVVPED